jgi:SAM-dependent methyltransferase
MGVTVLGRSRRLSLVALLLLTVPLGAQNAGKPFEPVEGQPGKDVPWVPTPDALVERMLDVAKVTPKDFVIDLGSGDGRNIIAAAKRGASGLGVEYNPDLVELSKRRAAEAGVSSRAMFVQGDMYLADISRASVLALFLLPQNMLRLKDKFLALAPGSRIVSNTFTVEGWEPDYFESIPNCEEWCTIYLYQVPAKIEGTWQTPEGTLTLTQSYQHFSGSRGTRPVDQGKIKGDQVTFTLAGSSYAVRATGDRLEGTVTTNGKTTSWTATRAGK